MRSYDKEKMKAYHKKHYEANKEQRMERTRNRRKEIQEILLKVKLENPCPCGESHPACLEFHHVNPEEKEIELGKVCELGWGNPRIQKELAKCIVICANCHRKLHYEEKLKRGVEPPQ